jgi:hypothetical protein
MKSLGCQVGGGWCDVVFYSIIPESSRERYKRKAFKIKELGAKKLLYSKSPRNSV